jgi:acyl-coenzyme A thioesterase PaaI-like protein
MDGVAGLAVMAALGAKHMDEPVAKRLHRFDRLGTIDMRVDYLRQAIGERFEVRAQVLRLGSRVANLQMSFWGPSEELIATGAAAFIVS